jgi:hypothetical protein
MTVKHKDYTIELVNDEYYSLNSTDNITYYNHIYIDDSENQGRYDRRSKHGIRIKKGDEELTSALIFGDAGATTIHKNSFIVFNNALLVCCSNKIYALNLPDLALNWCKTLDLITCFAIYALDQDFLIHGELQITRIDIEGNEKWTFGAKDIFVTQDGSDACTIQENMILLKDWQGNTYTLNKNGIEI